MSVSGCDDVVGPEGMEKFCEDIGVEPENVKQILMNLINTDTGLACYIVYLLYIYFFPWYILTALLVYALGLIYSFFFFL